MNGNSGGGRAGSCPGEEATSVGSSQGTQRHKRRCSESGFGAYVYVKRLGTLDGYTWVVRRMFGET